MFFSQLEQVTTMEDKTCVNKKISSTIMHLEQNTFPFLLGKEKKVDLQNTLLLLILHYRKLEECCIFDCNPFSLCISRCNTSKRVKEKLIPLENLPEQWKEKLMGITT